MTNGPPCTAAGSSKTPAVSATSQSTALPPTYVPSTGFTAQTYPNYAALNNPWMYPYSGYASTSSPSVGATTQQSHNPNITSNPYAGHIIQPQIYVPQISLRENPSAKPKPKPISKPSPTRPRSSTPPLPQPETFKHWDEVIKKFLIRTKMTQTLRGLENDMLVLNPEWEQQTIPEGLKAMVTDLQSIIDRVAGKKKAEDMDVDVESKSFCDNPIATEPKTDPDRSLDERKLDYVHLANGTQPRSQSSVNKSISQFLTQTRARNDASNRAEFLYTLAEKKRKLQEERGMNASEVEITSCARVDAKPIDRNKQMKYDIAKNGEGPLTKTVKRIAAAAASSSTANPSSALSDSALLGPSSSVIDNEGSKPPSQVARKRKFVDFEESNLDAVSVVDVPKDKGKGKGKGKRKGKGKEKSEVLVPGTEVNDDDLVLAAATAEKYPGLDQRLKNAEDHLALRYVPSPPRTLLARLKYLEDHIIKLEKEYPPWAALHFNQPNRGWPAPPRATPVIVPPQLRSSSSTTQTATSSAKPTVPITSTPTPTPSDFTSTAQASNAGAPTKPRKGNSSLHKAVLDRLEVQKAMSEINARRGQGT